MLFDALGRHFGLFFLDHGEDLGLGGFGIGLDDKAAGHEVQARFLHAGKFGDRTFEFRGAVGAVKVIAPVHYAGVACEMDTIMEIARRHGLMVVEDAAQGVMSTYKGKALSR